MTNQELGKMIKNLRQKNNMTQKELGEKLHITDKAISKWERGISMPDIEMLNSIANLFNIPVSNLIDNKIKDNEQKVSKNYINLTIILVLIIIIILSIIFGIKSNNQDTVITQEDLAEVYVGTKIASPDRIIYKDSKNNYYEFLNGTEEYSDLKGILQKSITSYTDSGMYLTNEEIDNIHKNSTFLEFDYKTISKNYIIQLSNNNNQAVIRLADNGGRVCTNKILNLDKICTILDDLTKNKTSYKLEYREFISENVIETPEFTDSLKQINKNIYQVKIDNIEDYNNFKNLYNLSINQDITEKTFEKNKIILTINMDYDISIKVNPRKYLFYI